MIALPVKVLLRNRTVATVTSTSLVGPNEESVRVLQGEKYEGGFELWFPNGKWRETARPHPLDIVGFLNPDGAMRPLTNEFAD
jgi:hypothetical protein